jgi:hypothetical protein
MSQNKASEPWIRELERLRPDLVAPYVSALDAYALANEHGILSDEQVASLRTGAAIVNFDIGLSVSEMLMRLGTRFPVAAQAFLEVSRHSKAQVRLNAIAALVSGVPSTLHDVVLTERLRDRSFKVRRLAAEKIMLLRLRHLRVGLDQAICDAGTDAERRSLTWNRDLLIHGYHARPGSNGTVDLTFRIANGVSNISVSPEEFHSKGAMQIAKENRIVPRVV